MAKGPVKLKDVRLEIEHIGAEPFEETVVVESTGKITIKRVSKDLRFLRPGDDEERMYSKEFKLSEADFKEIEDLIIKADFFSAREKYRFVHSNPIEPGILPQPQEGQDTVKITVLADGPRGEKTHTVTASYVYKSAKEFPPELKAVYYKICKIVEELSGLNC